MKIEIAEQLKKEEFRFCPLLKGTKISYKSHNKVNYTYYDKHLLELLNLGDNYGVLGGYGNLIIIDVDSDIILQEIQKLNLPETFTIISALKKKPHYYFITKTPKNSRAFEKLDIKGIGGYVVGSNSLVKDEDKKTNELFKYEIQKNIPIAYLSDEDFNKIIQLGERHPKKKEDSQKPKKNNLPKMEEKPKPEKKVYENSYYFTQPEKEAFIGQKQKAIVLDSWKMPTDQARQFKIKLEDGRTRTIDFNKYHEGRLLRILLKTKTFILSCEWVFDERGKHKRWIVEEDENDFINDF